MDGFLHIRGVERAIVVEQTGDVVGPYDAERLRGTGCLGEVYKFGQDRAGAIGVGDVVGPVPSAPIAPIAEAPIPGITIPPGIVVEVAEAVGVLYIADL